MLWLRTECGLDVRCIEMVPHQIDGRKLLATQTLIPTPAAADYMVTIGEKTRQTREAGLRARSKPVVQELVKMGRLKSGDKVVLLRAPISTDHPNIPLQPDQKTAVFISGNRFRWSFDGSSQTLTGICKEIFKAATGLDKPFPGPSYFALDGEIESLTSLCQRLQNPDGDEDEDSELPAAED